MKTLRLGDGETGSGGLTPAATSKGPGRLVSANLSVCEYALALHVMYATKARNLVLRMRHAGDELAVLRGWAREEAASARAFYQDFCAAKKEVEV